MVVITMGKIFSKIKGLLSKLLMIVAIIIVAIIVINWGQEVNIFGLPLQGWQLGLLAAIAAGLAFIIDGDQAAKMVGSIKKGATKIVEAAGDVLGSALTSVGGAVTSSIGSWIIPIGVVLGGYYLISRGDLDNDNKK